MSSLQTLILLMAIFIPFSEKMVLASPRNLKILVRSIQAPHFTILESQGVLVKNSHTVLTLFKNLETILIAPNKMELILDTGKTQAKPSKFAINPILGLALLEFNENLGRPLTLADNEATIGEDVFIESFEEKGNTFPFYKINDNQERHYCFNIFVGSLLSIKEGNPIFNLKGNLVGMDIRSKINQVKSIRSPCLRNIKEFLKEAPVSFNSVFLGFYQKTLDLQSELIEEITQKKEKFILGKWKFSFANLNKDLCKSDLFDFIRQNENWHVCEPMYPSFSNFLFTPKISVRYYTVDTPNRFLSLPSFWNFSVLDAYKQDLMLNSWKKASTVEVNLTSSKTCSVKLMRNSSGISFRVQFCLDKNENFKNFSDAIVNVSSINSTDSFILGFQFKIYMMTREKILKFLYFVLNSVERTKGLD